MCTKALEDFADVLVAQAGARWPFVKLGWTSLCAGVQMAVTGADKLFPAPVVEAVECIYRLSGQFGT